MTEPQPQRRMAENEVIFRQYNERIKTRFDGIKREARADRRVLAPSDNTTLSFYCECADEQCKKRIDLRPSEYEATHKQKNRFIVIPGHEVEMVERVIAEEEAYYITEKYLTPPDIGTTLNPTPIHNT